MKHTGKKVVIEVVNIKTREVVDTVETKDWNADRVERGMLINMSPKYFTRIKKDAQ